MPDTPPGFIPFGQTKPKAKPAGFIPFGQTSFTPANAMRGKAGTASGVESLLSGPLAPFLKTAGKVASPVLNFMNRGAEALMSVAGQQPAPGHEWDFGQALQRAGPTIAKALAGNETPEQYQADTQSAKSKFGLGKLTGLPGAAAGFGFQTFFDPLMHTGPLTRAAHSAIEAGTLPLAMKFGSKLPEGVQKLFSAAHTLTNVDGPLKQYLASNFPNDWMDKYAGFYGSRAAAGSAKNTMEYAFTSRFKNAIHGLSESDQRRVFMFLDGHSVRMSPGLTQKAAAIKELTDTEHYLKGDQAAQDALTQRGFQLPAWAERFDPAAPRDISNVGTYREHYVPTPKKFKSALAKPKVASSISTFDPSLLQRKNLPLGAFKDVAGIREGFGTHFGSGARVMANTDLENQLRDVLHIPPGTPIPDPVLQGFQRAVLPEHLQPASKPITDAMKTAQDIDKTAMFSTPTRHMMNVGNLAAMADPASIPGGLARYLKTAGMGPEARSEFFKNPIAHGAVQTGQVEGDRGSRFAQLLTDTGQHLEDKSRAPIAASSRRGIPVTRYQGSPGAPSSPLRGGTFFNRNLGDKFYGSGDALGAGGKHKIEGYLNPTNPLRVDAVPGDLGDAALEKLRGNRLQGMNLSGRNPRQRQNIMRYFKAAGLPDSVARDYANAMETGLGQPDTMLLSETLANKYAKAAGHDAILSGQEAVSLNPKIFSKKSPFDALKQRAGRVSGFDELVGRGAVGLAGKALKMGGSYFKAVGDQLWKFDDALKASQFDRLVKKGMSPDRAGLEVNASMVDYNTSSPLADSLRAWAPFITWRSKFPMAVGRSMLRNPGNVNMLARAFPQAAGETVQSNGQGYTSNLPLADALSLTKGPGLFGGPVNYLRGTMGTPGRLIMNAVDNARADMAQKNDETARLRDQNWWTYGAPGSTYAQSQIPVWGQTINPLLGKGLFGDTPMENLIYQQTGVHKVPPQYPTSTKQEFLRQYTKDHPNAKPSDGANAWYQHTQLLKLLRRYSH